MAAGCTQVLSATVSGVGSPSGGTPENTAEPINALDIPGHPGIEACTTAQVESDLEVARAFDESIHELVVCGGMAAQLSVGFYDVFIDAALGNRGGADGWVHVGDGQWQTQNGVMEAQFVLPFDTSWGREGDVIPFDVLDPYNYFTEFTAVAEASVSLTGEARTELYIEFTGTEPGFELLGISHTPGTASLSLDFDEMVARLGAIRMRQDVVIEDERGDVNVYYHVIGADQPIENLVFAQAGTGMTIENAWAEHQLTGQRLEVTDWNMEYQGGAAGTLDGTIDVQVTGGSFDYVADFVFPHRKYPDVTLGCL